MNGVIKNIEIYQGGSMDRIKEMILSDIEKGGIKDVADCVAAITGWYGQSEDKTVPVELLKLVLGLAISGKIEF